MAVGAKNEILAKITVEKKRGDALKSALKAFWEVPKVEPKKKSNKK